VKRKTRNRRIGSARAAALQAALLCLRFLGFRELPPLPCRRSSNCCFPVCGLLASAVSRHPLHRSLTQLRFCCLPSRSQARKMSGKLDEHYDKWSKIAADIEDDEPSPDPGTRPLPPAQTTPHAVASLCSGALVSARAPDSNAACCGTRPNGRPSGDGRPARRDAAGHGRDGAPHAPLPAAPSSRALTNEDLQRSTWGSSWPLANGWACVQGGGMPPGMMGGGMPPGMMGGGMPPGMMGGMGGASRSPKAACAASLAAPARRLSCARVEARRRGADSLAPTRHGRHDGWPARRHDGRPARRHDGWNGRCVSQSESSLRKPRSSSPPTLLCSR